MDDMKVTKPSQLIRATLDSGLYRPGRAVKPPGSEYLCLAINDYLERYVVEEGNVFIVRRLLSQTRGYIGDSIYPHSTINRMWQFKHGDVPGWAERLTFWDQLVRKLEEQGL